MAVTAKTAQTMETCVQGELAQSQVLSLQAASLDTAASVIWL